MNIWNVDSIASQETVTESWQPFWEWLKGKLTNSNKKACKIDPKIDPFWGKSMKINYGKMLQKISVKMSL